MKKIKIPDQIIFKVESQNFKMESSVDGLMSEILCLTGLFGVYYYEGDLYVIEGNKAAVKNKTLTIE